MNRPAARKASSTKPTPHAAPSRGERRKGETRQRLLDAAFRLMAQRGADAVAITEITEAADVGIGSFYNHFDSKEDVYRALVDDVFERFADALDGLLADVQDPAEVISVSVRFAVLRARQQPLWGRFLLREGLSSRVLERGLGVRLMRDVRRGIDAKRFKVDDPLLTFVSVAAAVLSAMSLELNYTSGDAAGTLKQLGFEAKDIPERAATVVLQGLGLDLGEARKLARCPLPEGPQA